MVQSNNLNKDVSFSRLESAVLHLVRGVIGRRSYCSDKESSIFAAHIYSLLNLLQELHRFKERRAQLFSKKKREFQHNISDLHKEQLISDIVFSIQVIVEQLEHTPFGDYIHMRHIVDNLKRIKKRYNITEDRTSEVLPDAKIAVSYKEDKVKQDYDDRILNHNLIQNNVNHCDNVPITTFTVSARAEPKQTYPGKPVLDDEHLLNRNPIQDNVDHQDNVSPTTFTVSARAESKQPHSKVPSKTFKNKAFKKLPYTGFIKAKVGNLVYDQDI